MIRNNAALTGTSLAAYVNALLAKTGKSPDDASAAGGANAALGAGADPASLQKAQAAALSASAKSFKFAGAQRTLDQQRANLATQLTAGLAKAGFKLGGTVEFSLGSDGKLAVQGSDSDRTLVNAFLKHDTSQPRLSSQITALAKGADQLSATIRQSAAISQAARYAGSSANVMSLYGTLMQQQDQTSATFSLSGSSSSLTYPGVLASKA